ncbi:MAG: ABC transporter permease, partial [Flavobacteriaceae bacterium]|nr:ABC transporter permease [Flavobacteriaceae bacterium]
MNILFFLKSSINIELIKLKHTIALWLTIVCAMIFPILFFIAYLIRHKILVPKNGANPWDKFMFMQIENSTPFFIPMFIVLITSLIMYNEHKSMGLKYLFTLPGPRWSIYFGKLIVTIFAIFTTYIYYYIIILLLGILLGIIFPELEFLNFQPQHTKFIRILVNSFLASLGIIGIQFWISFKFSNMIIPLGAVMFLKIICIILSQCSQSFIF